MGQALIQLLDGHLLQVRIVQPDLLAVGDQQLFQRRIGMPAELAGALERHLAGGFLQVGAGGIQGQLGETPRQGLGFSEQVSQPLHRGGIVRLRGKDGKANGQYQKAQQVH